MGLLRRSARPAPEDASIRIRWPHGAALEPFDNGPRRRGSKWRAMSRASARPELRSDSTALPPIAESRSRQAVSAHGRPLSGRPQGARDVVWTVAREVVRRGSQEADGSPCDRHPAGPSISFSGPNNWTYSSPVEDRKALERVKVGDKVDIMWTVALLVSFEIKK